MAATTQEVLAHHLDTFGKGDLTGVMADYSPESRLFTPNGMLKGPEAIRQLFRTQFKEFAKPGASFQMLRQDVDGDTAYILWKAETRSHRGTGQRIRQRSRRPPRRDPGAKPRKRWSICETHHEVGGVTIDTGSIPRKTPPMIRLAAFVAEGSTASRSGC